jgi:hypothetical protein
MTKAMLGERETEKSYSNLIYTISLLKIRLLKLCYVTKKCKEVSDTSQK